MNKRDRLLKEASYCEFRLQRRMAAKLRAKAAKLVGGNPAVAVETDPEVAVEPAE